MIACDGVFVGVCVCVHVCMCHSCNCEYHKKLFLLFIGENEMNSGLNLAREGSSPSHPQHSNFLLKF